MSEIKLQLDKWIENRQLTKVIFVEKKQGHRLIYGRVLEFCEVRNLVLFYNDDEKKVYNLSLIQIENIEAATDSLGNS